MAKQSYADGATYPGPHRLFSRRAAMVEAANAILEEYREAGRLPITLRALWYQMVARGHLLNSASDNNSFYGAMKDARNLGLVDWNDITEEGRELHAFARHASPVEVIDPDKYTVDRWAEQPVRVEVWVEKAAQLGTLARVCARWRVPYLSGGGFASTTAMQSAGRRMVSYRESGQDPVLLYLGDHDPSGLWMDEDIRQRLDMYTSGQPPMILRLGLTNEQAQDLPPNRVDPDSDRGANSHLRRYEEQFGKDAPQWEMDALPPDAIEELIENAVKVQIADADAWERAAGEESRGRGLLNTVRANWTAIAEEYRS